jgi:hypothetical protein
MSYGIIHFFPGGTTEQYDAVLQAVHPGEFELPEGQLFHAAGPSEGGWTVIAIHDSEESWVKFRDETLMPLMQQGVEGGFTSRPTETGFQSTSNFRSARATAIRGIGSQRAQAISRGGEHYSIFSRHPYSTAQVSTRCRTTGPSRCCRYQACPAGATSVLYTLTPR